MTDSEGTPTPTMESTTITPDEALAGLRANAPTRLWTPSDTKLLGVGIDSNATWARGTQAAVDHGYRYEITNHWDRPEPARGTDPLAVEFPDENVLYFDTNDTGGEMTVILEVAYAVMILTIHPRSVSATAVASSAQAARDAIAYVRALFPAAGKLAEPETIPVHFWWGTDRGPQNVRREIAAPAWESVQGNYGAKTLTGLEALMSPAFRPAHGGHLILWHGDPGTGKTYALRALLAQWRKWCSAHYIIDPERLFGGDSSYLMTMLLTETGPSAALRRALLEDDEYEGDERDRDRDQWKLLILEDAGELVEPTAKSVTGQGLSRLLNITDGFIGQGLRVLILITTNSAESKLHPAVARPGRSSSVVEFDKLSIAEKNAWAIHNKVDPASLPGGPRTLAELYEKREGFPARAKTITAEVGFRAPEAGNGTKPWADVRSEG